MNKYRAAWLALVIAVGHQNSTNSYTKKEILELITLTQMMFGFTLSDLITEDVHKLVNTEQAFLESLRKED